MPKVGIISENEKPMKYKDCLTAHYTIVLHKNLTPRYNNKRLFVRDVIKQQIHWTRLGYDAVIHKF